MADNRTSLMVYFSLEPTIRMITDEEAGILFKAMLIYGKTGEIPELSGTPALLWTVIQPMIDRDGERYQERIISNTYAVYCREEKRKGKTPLSKSEWAKERYKSALAISPDNHPLSHDNKRYPNTNTDSISNSNTISKPISNKKGFIKPSIDEINEYINKKGYSVDAEAFFDYYEANGWKIGKNPMRDWKSAVNYWERNKNDGKRKCNGSSDSTERIPGGTSL